MNYSNPKIVLQEVPDEITLAISISGCPMRCEGCHSAFTRDPEYGEKLTDKVLNDMIDNNKGISCVLFYGGDWDIENLVHFMKLCKNKGLKVALYSGYDEFFPEIVKIVDYYKVGPYMEDRGPLSNPDTNQYMFKIIRDDHIMEFCNITSLFWRKIEPTDINFKKNRSI